MRQVFSNSMAAHVWAQQNQDHGRGHGNVSFQGTTFYSYATPIANFVTDKNGERVCLITNESYSSSTGKHLGYVRRALQGAASFYGDIPNGYVVPHIGVEGGRSPRLDRSSDLHAANFAFLLADYRTTLASAKRGQKRYGYEQAHFVRMAERLREYAERFDVADDTLPDAAADWQAIQDAEAARNTPKGIAKREKAAEARINRKRADYREVRGSYGEDWETRYRHRLGTGGSEIFTDEDQKARAEKLGKLEQAKIDWARDEYRTATGQYGLDYDDDRWSPYKEHFTDDDKAQRAVAFAKLVEHRRYEFRTVTGRYASPNYTTRDDSIFTGEDRAARAARVTEINADKVKAWREGSNVLVPHDGEQGALLRLSKDGKTVETSWGAEFPVEHARKAFPAVNCCRVKGREYVRNGHTIHLGHFVLDRVSAEGDVTAGCHFVRWTEIERVARELGLLPPEGNGVSEAA